MQKDRLPHALARTSANLSSYRLGLTLVVANRNAICVGRKSTRVAGAEHLSCRISNPIALCDCILHDQLVQLCSVNRY
jgi:hypothetical protein